MIRAKYKYVSDLKGLEDNEFNTQQDAEAAEKVILLSEQLRDEYGAHEQECLPLAKWLLANYNMEPK